MLAVGFAVALAVVFGAPVVAQADDLPAPAVTTLIVTNAGTTTATFHAKVVTNNTAATAYFVYGTAPDQLTSRTPDVSFAAGSGELPLDAAVTGLSTNTKYYVVAVAENDDWIVRGGVETFTTMAPPQILGSSMSDVTYKSATLHLNVVTYGQPVAVLGTVKSDSRLVLDPAAGSAQSAGGVETSFGPYLSTANGDVAIPLSGLESGVGYTWNARATGFLGEATSSGKFFTESLVAVSKPTLTPEIAPYGSLVTISGTIRKPGLALALAEQAFPFTGSISPLAGMTTATGATGVYEFNLRAEHPAAYGVTADGAVGPTAANVTRLKVIPVVIAKIKRAKRHWFTVVGRYQPAIVSKVSLFRRGGGRVGVARASKGTFQFPARALRAGKYEVRVTPAASTGFEKVKSAAVIVPRG